MESTAPRLTIVPLKTIEIQTDSGAVTVERMGLGFDYRLLSGKADRLPFVIHLKRTRVKVVDGWGFKDVTKWRWSVGWQKSRKCVSYVHNDAPTSFTDALSNAVAMALAWSIDDKPGEFLAQEWRRSMGLATAQRYLRSVAELEQAIG